MSWMTKGGSSSASGQSLLRFPLNEPARRKLASTIQEAATATRCDCVVDSPCDPQPGNTTKGADTCWTGRVGKPPDEGGVYPSEGFG
jgi:hypothetical protein